MKVKIQCIYSKRLNYFHNVRVGILSTRYLTILSLSFNISSWYAFTSSSIYLCNTIIILQQVLYLSLVTLLIGNELFNNKLFEHCAEIDETARNRMELIVRSLAEQNGVTEQLKAENQMEWVRQMNACKAQAEEIVRVELIYD